MDKINGRKRYPHTCRASDQVSSLCGRVMSAVLNASGGEAVEFNSQVIFIASQLDRDLCGNIRIGTGYNFTESY